MTRVIRFIQVTRCSRARSLCQVWQAVWDKVTRQRSPIWFRECLHSMATITQHLLLLYWQTTTTTKIDFVLHRLPQCWLAICQHRRQALTRLLWTALLRWIEMNARKQRSARTPKTHNTLVAQTQAWSTPIRVNSHLLPLQPIRITLFQCHMPWLLAKPRQLWPPRWLKRHRRLHHSNRRPNCWIWPRLPIKSKGSEFVLVWMRLGVCRKIRHLFFCAFSKVVT